MFASSDINSKFSKGFPTKNSQPQDSHIRINYTNSQISCAGNTCQSRPILQVMTVCEFMCAWISVFLLTGGDASIRCPYSGAPHIIDRRVTIKYMMTKITGSGCVCVCFFWKTKQFK